MSRILAAVIGLAAAVGSPETARAEPFVVESNHPATRAMADCARRLSRETLSAEVRRHSDKTPFSAYYLKFVRESGFQGGRNMISDADSGELPADEASLGRNILAFDTLWAQNLPIPQSTLHRTIFSMCLLATYAGHLDLSAADDLAGDAAALLAWLEVDRPGDAAILFFRGWIFYLAGDAPGGLQALANAGGDPWKQRAAALDMYIRKDAAALEKISDTAEPWTGMLASMALEGGTADSAILAYKNAYTIHRDILLPFLTVGDIAELGNPEASKHRLTEMGWRLVLDAVAPDDDDPAGQYQRLMALADNRSVLAGALKEFYLGYFRRAVFTRHEFVQNILNNEPIKQNFFDELSGIGDPIVEYVQAMKDIRESRLNESAARFRKIQPELRDPYLAERLMFGFPEEWGAPFVNDVQGRPYESWRYYRHAGLMCSRYAWYKKASRYMENSLALNPYQPDLKEILKTYQEMSAGGKTGFDPKTDETLGTKFAFSVWSPEIERALAYVERDTAYVPANDGFAFDIVNWMETRGSYDTAIDFARRCLATWPKNIYAANLSAKIGWIHLKRKKDVEAARLQFEKMEKFGNGSNLLGLAECYEKSGNQSEAEERYRDDDDRYGEADAHFPLAAYYVRAGKSGAALALLQSAAGLYGGANPRRELFTYALTFYVDESYPTLVQMLYEKVVPDRESWISYDYSQWALSYMLTGNYDKVRQIVVEAKREKKYNPFLDYFLYAIACKQKNWPAATESIRATTGKYYHRYLPGALIDGKDQAELEEYSRGKPQYQSYLSSMYGLLAYRRVAEGNRKAADRLFRIAAGSVNYATWHIPILASHEIGERVPIIGAAKPAAGAKSKTGR